MMFRRRHGFTPASRRRVILGLTLLAASAALIAARPALTMQASGAIRGGGGVGAGRAAGAVRSLPSSARRLTYQNRPYYYSGGYWYMPYYQGWDIEYYPTIPPIGMVFQWPPSPYQVVRRGPYVYAVSQGVYYQQFLNGGLVYYRVVGYAQ